jgi:hypothetical protein
LLLEMFICCGIMPTDHGNCWPMSSQKYLKKICILNHIFFAIFCNVQKWSEKCWWIGNIKIWLEFFSTSFWLQASAVPINQVKYAFKFNSPCRKKALRCCWCIFLNLE